MGNVRVFQLARDLNLSSQEIIERLHNLGVEAKTASSSIDEDAADKLKRAVRIEVLTSKQKRFYGSDEDESEREQEQKALADRIAAERDEREQAAAAARAAAEARKHGRHRKAETGVKGETEVAPALLHAPGAPRLVRKSTAVQLPLPGEPTGEHDTAQDSAHDTAHDTFVSEAEAAEEPVAEVAAPVEAPEITEEAVQEAGEVETPVPAADTVRPAPRLGPLRPIAPVAPKAPEPPPTIVAPEPEVVVAPSVVAIDAPAEPAEAAPAAAIVPIPRAPVAEVPPQVLAPVATPPPPPLVVRPVAPIPRLVRPIAPPPKPSTGSARPVGPHVTATSPRPTVARPISGHRRDAALASHGCPRHQRSLDGPTFDDWRTHASVGPHGTSWGTVETVGQAGRRPLAYRAGHAPRGAARLLGSAP